MAATVATAPRADVRPLLERTNRHAVALLAAHVASLLAAGLWVWSAIGSWWVVPALVADGVVMAHLFALLHECSHRTAFRSRRANRTVAWLCGLVVGLPPRYFLLEHTAHHRFTQQADLDPELIDVPSDRRHYVLFLAGGPYWWWAGRTLSAHAAGHLLAFEGTFVPAGRAPARRAAKRAGSSPSHAVAIAASIAIGSTAAAVVVGAAPARGRARHARRPPVRACRARPHGRRRRRTPARCGSRYRCGSWRGTCRSMPSTTPMPSVPFHALPRLHTLLAPPPSGGYLAAQREILRADPGATPGDLGWLEPGHR